MVFLFSKKKYIKNKKLFYGKGYKILADFIYNISDIKFQRFILILSRKKGSSKMSLKVLIILLFFIKNLNLTLDTINRITGYH